MKRFKNILIDLSDFNENPRTLKRFAELAERNGAKVTLFRNIEKPPTYFSKISAPAFGDDYIEELKRDTRTYLEAFADQEMFKDLDLTLRHTIGTKGIETVKETLRREIDLVVIPRGVSVKTIHDNTSVTKIFRKSPCPVLVGSGLSPIDTVGVCVDPEGVEGERLALNVKCLQLGHSLAKERGANLLVLSVYIPFLSIRARRYMSAAQIESHNQVIGDAARSEVLTIMKNHSFSHLQEKLILVKGQPEVEIPELVHLHEIDLLVMGNLARTGISGYFIGNTAEKIIQGLSCDLLTLKAEGFTSPL